MSTSASDDRKPAASRREFMRTGGAATAAALAGGVLPAPARASEQSQSPHARSATMPTRNLGRTGFRAAIFSLGGQAALEWANNEAAAVPLVERAASCSKQALFFRFFDRA